MKCKKLLSMVCMAVTVCLLMNVVIRTAVSVSAQDAVSYIDYEVNAEGKLIRSQKTCTNYTKISYEDDEWKNGWYVAEGKFDLDNRVTVSGIVYLILKDGAELTVTLGIDVSEENTLYIYAQSESEQTGTLISKNFSNGAGIGSGYHGSGGTVTINGGTVTATGGSDGAGIGGGYKGSGGTVTVNGGTVTATGGMNGAGIGSGIEGTGGTVTVNGGTVTATGNYGAGIGSGYHGSGGTVTINGGTVNATGNYGAGIGAGCYGSGGTVTVNSSTVTAKSDYGSGIGAGWKSTDHGTLLTGEYITIFGGDDENSAYNAFDTDSNTRYRYMRSAYTFAYMVTIPDEITVGQTADISATTFDIGEDLVLCVKVWGNSVQLRDGSHSIECGIYADNSHLPERDSENILLSVPDKKKDVSAGVALIPENVKFPGIYTGTLTFSVGLENT